MGFKIFDSIAGLENGRYIITNQKMTNGLVIGSIGNMIAIIITNHTEKRCIGDIYVVNERYFKKTQKIDFDYRIIDFNKTHLVDTSVCKKNFYNLTFIEYIDVLLNNVSFSSIEYCNIKPLIFPSKTNKNVFYDKEMNFRIYRNKYNI